MRKEELGIRPHPRPLSQCTGEGRKRLTFPSKEGKNFARSSFILALWENQR